MEDVDNDPFGKCESRSDEPMDENIPLAPVGRSSWEPEHQQETSFRRETSLEEESQKPKLVKKLYLELFKHLGHIPKEFHFDNFEFRDKNLYYNGKDKSLTTMKEELRMSGELWKILGMKRLRNLSFGIPKGKVNAQEAEKLNRVEEELPSASDVAKADDIEIQEIMKNVMKSTDDLIAQFEREETLPMCELLGLDKQLRSIRG